MEIVQLIASIMTVIGMPSLFAFFLILHKKQVDLLKDRIKNLEERAPAKVLANFKALKELYDTKIQEYEDRKKCDAGKKEELNRRVVELQNIIANLEEYMSGAYYVS